jgi:hypothetical protein
MIIANQRRLTQPPAGFAAVNWRDPISRGLMALFDMPSGRCLVTGRTASSLSGSPATSAAGRCTDYSGGTNTQFAHHPNFATVGAMTIAIYCDVDALSGYTHLISKEGGPTTNIAYEIRGGCASPTDARMSFIRGNAGGYKQYGAGGSILTATRKKFIVVRYADGEASNNISGLFLDDAFLGLGGITAIGGTATGPVTDNGSAVWIGRRSDSSSINFDGRIYYVALWNRALGDQEITDLNWARWRLYEPAGSSQYFDTAVSGSTFQAAWAVNANSYHSQGASHAA